MAAAAAPPEAASARCGPTDLAGVLDLPRALAEQVWGARNLEGAAQKKEERHREEQGAFQDLQDLAKLGIVATSCYSGTGTYEAVLHRIMTCAAKTSAASAKPQLIMYSACEVCPLARAVLASHPAASRPRHIFGDILDRVPAAVLSDLRAVEQHYMKLWQDTKAEFALKNITKSEATQWHSQLSESYVASLMPIFSALEFNGEAWCYLHKKKCPISPRQGGYSTQLWTEAAGTTCCPWSSMPINIMNKWLDPATLPCLTWAFGLRFYCPDMFQHECTEAFPHCMLDRILNPMRAASVPHCVHARHIPEAWGQVSSSDSSDAGGDSDIDAASVSSDLMQSGRPLDIRCQKDQNDQWWLSSCVFSPTDLGVPSCRRRKYTMGYWLPFLRPRADVISNAQSFGARFFRELKCDARVFLNADSARELLPLEGSPSCSAEGQQSGAARAGAWYPSELDDLTPAVAARLESHLLAARAAGHCDDLGRNWSCAFALADSTQNGHFRQISVSTMPTLLRKTRLWDLVQDKPVNILSIMCAQGFPAPARGVPEEFAALFPFKSMLSLNGEKPKRKRQRIAEIGIGEGRKLSDEEVKQLVGNSFHWASIAAWLCYALSSWKM